MELKIEALAEEFPGLDDSLAEDVFVVRGFCPPELCSAVVDQAHRAMAQLPHRTEERGLFYSLDVLPTGVETDRIFRSLEYLPGGKQHWSPEASELFSLLEEFQMRFVVDEADLSESAERRFQLLHYPRGGGFFGWHEHPRFPVNYGLILNLTEQGSNFDQGATEFEREDGSVISAEDVSTVGDLVLFRFDMRHRVSACDPGADLVFDTNGRWTAVVPIFQ